MENERAIIIHEDGGVRESATGKGSYKWMPMVALKRVSHRYEYGHLKYGVEDNYKKGLPTGDCWDSAMRHLIEYMDGDNSEDHLAAVVWNCNAIMEMEMHNPKYQTIPSRKKFRGKDFDYRFKEVK